MRSPCIGDRGKVCDRLKPLISVTDFFLRDSRQRERGSSLHGRGRRFKILNRHNDLDREFPGSGLNVRSQRALVDGSIRGYS
jgi:hypothetical protein